MPAKVTIQSGISAGTSYWIERPVVRVGSDPNSDVCLPSANVPSHALTLEFRDGAYRIHNRCEENVFVGTRVVEPGTAIAWPDTDILQLNGEIELVLDVEEDPRPKPMRPRLNPVADLAGLETSSDWQHESEHQRTKAAIALWVMNQLNPTLRQTIRQTVPAFCCNWRSSFSAF